MVTKVNISFNTKFLHFIQISCGLTNQEQLLKTVSDADIRISLQFGSNIIHYFCCCKIPFCLLKYDCENPVVERFKWECSENLFNPEPLYSSLGSRSSFTNTAVKPLVTRAGKTLYLIQSVRVCCYRVCDTYIPPPPTPPLPRKRIKKGLLWKILPKCSVIIMHVDQIFLYSFYKKTFLFFKLSLTLRDILTAFFRA